MDARESDLAEKARTLESLLRENGSAEELYQTAMRAALALGFRATDTMVGLAPSDQKLVQALESLVDRALGTAAEAGHEEACLAAARSIWATRNTRRADAAHEYAMKVSTWSEGAFLLGLFHFHGFGTTKDLKASLTWHTRAAEAGSADAMFELYAMWSQGLGCARDPATAVRFCHQAAEAGNTRAMANLGAFYAIGNGVPRDAGKSVHWYEKAARGGHGKAAATLGVMYGLGGDVPQSEEKARMFFALAEESGFDWQTLARATGLDPSQYMPEGD